MIYTNSKIRQSRGPGAECQIPASRGGGAERRLLGLRVRLRDQSPGDADDHAGPAPVTGRPAVLREGRRGKFTGAWLPGAGSAGGGPGSSVGSACSPCSSGAVRFGGLGEPGRPPSRFVSAALGSPAGPAGDESKGMDRQVCRAGRVSGAHFPARPDRGSDGANSSGFPGCDTLAPLRV